MKNRIVKFFIELFLFLLIVGLIFSFVLNQENRKIIFITAYIISLIFEIGIFIHIVQKEDYTYNKILWLIILFAIPVLGIVFYFTFNREFKVYSLNIDRPLLKNQETLDNKLIEYQDDLEKQIFGFAESISSRNLFQNNTASEILTNGDQFFPRLMEELQKAEKFIYLQFYILKVDEIGTEVLEILREKNRIGVQCRIIFDPIGSRLKKHAKKYLKMLKQEGIKIEAFEEVKNPFLVSKLNFRNHRKIQVIDGKVGFIGGINLGDEYIHRSKKFGFWRDTSMVVRGAGVRSLERIFIKDWYYITNNYLTFSEEYSKEDQKGLFITIESGPDSDSSNIKELFYKMIISSKKSIKITTPYLMLEPEMSFALINASKSGIDVQILVPGLADKFLINQATKSYYERLLKHGIKVYEYKNIFVHSKTIVIDDRIASLGTANFDPRSFNINFEVTSLFNGESVSKLVLDFENDLKYSNLVDYENWKTRSFFSKLFQNILNLMSPLL